MRVCGRLRRRQPGRLLLPAALRGLPAASRPCQLARTFISISSISNCLLHPAPDSPFIPKVASVRFPCLLGLRHRGCGAELGGCRRRGTRGCSSWEWLYSGEAPSLEVRTSSADCLGVSPATGAVSPACLGDSCGLGTQFSRNAALNGHNRCCCAASSPRDSLGGHTLAITRSFALPLPGCSALCSQA